MNAAFVFDMDGTVINNMEYHFKAWRRTVDELGGTLDNQSLRKQLYGKNEEVLRRIFGDNRFTAQQLEEISERKEVYYRSLYKDHIQPVAGLNAFLEQSHALSIPMALGTASYIRNIDLVLDTLHIRKYFKAIVSAGDVNKSKPDPETFLRAAEKLNVPPQDCIVFEDVPKGVEAAANAGMNAVVITTQHKPEDFNGCKNILEIIPDYTLLHPKELMQSFFSKRSQH